MAGERLKQRGENADVGFKPQAAKLFDQFCKPDRPPLTERRNYGRVDLDDMEPDNNENISEPVGKKRAVKNRVLFDDNVLYDSPQHVKQRKNRTRKPHSKKTLDIKDAVLKAFEQDGRLFNDLQRLDDHELFVSVAKPGERVNLHAKPETPPIAHLLEIFADKLPDSTDKRPAERRKSRRLQTEISFDSRDSLCEGTFVLTPDDHGSVKTRRLHSDLHTGIFKKDLLENRLLASTPLASKRGEMSRTRSRIAPPKQSNASSPKLRPRTSVLEKLTPLIIDKDFVNLRAEYINQRRPKPKQASTPKNASEKFFSVQDSLSSGGSSDEGQSTEETMHTAQESVFKAPEVPSSRKSSAVRPLPVATSFASSTFKTPGLKSGGNAPLSSLRLAQVASYGARLDAAITRNSLASYDSALFQRSNLVLPNSTMNFTRGAAANTTGFNRTAMSKTNMTAHRSALYSSMAHRTIRASAAACTSRMVVPDVSRKTIQNSDIESRTLEAAANVGLKTFLEASFAAAFTETNVVCDNGQTKVLSAKEKVLALCEPDNITNFKAVFTNTILKNTVKIGEGSYGEVFKSTSDDGSDIVLKLVPFSLDMDEDDVFAQILPELVISSQFKTLQTHLINRTPNFINMVSATCVRGKFPAKLVKEWDAYDQRKVSENVNPREYESDHLHLVMILNNGGTDLESYVFKTSQEAISIFAQVAYSLAASECEFLFEHRDLHWGNILVKDFAEEELDYVIASEKYKIPTAGLAASIIDFSLSRMSRDGITIFDDLSKYEDLFEGKGDYQFDIYRMMKKNNANDWESFNPKSNVFWLHYTLDKLTTAKKYKSRSKLHQSGLVALKTLKENILHFNSAQEFVESDALSTLFRQ